MTEHATVSASWFDHVGGSLDDPSRRAVSAFAVDAAPLVPALFLPACQGERADSHSLFVGSGAVEFGWKAVIGQHLKLSGVHWTAAGASAALRCQQASRSEDQIWNAQRNQTPAA